MTLDELIEELEEMRDNFGGETLVRGVFQPNYPLIAQIETVTMFDFAESDERGVYIGLADGKNYGTELHYEGGVVTDDDQDGFGE